MLVKGLLVVSRRLLRVLVSWGIKMMSSRTKIPRAILLASGV